MLIKTFKIFAMLLLLVSGCARSPDAVQHDFFMAVKQREPDEITAALKNGAQINAPIPADVASEMGVAGNDQTALIYAVETSRTEIVPLLLKNKADVNLYDETGFTALHYAIRFMGPTSRTHVVELLLKNGADVNAHRPPPGTLSRPLHLACDEMNLPVIKLLLDKGADVNAMTDSGRTALMIVAGKNLSPVKLPVLKLLLSKGANKKPVDDEKRTARDYALKSHDAQAVALLK
jgi:ankyrin repeat protein